MGSVETPTGSAERVGGAAHGGGGSGWRSHLIAERADDTAATLASEVATVLPRARAESSTSAKGSGSSSAIRQENG